MTSISEQQKDKSWRSFFRIVAHALTVTLFLVALAGCASTTQPSFTRKATALPTMTTTTPCSFFPSVQETSWSPIGSVWKLTVFFLSGSRQGQSEQSLMTFSPDGSLMATFPGATASAPPALPPAVDGSWCMTGINAFRYQFKDLILHSGKIVAYVATHIDANLTSKTTFEAGGVGIAYAAATGQPLPAQYGVTRTVAVASVR